MHDLFILTSSPVKREDMYIFYALELVHSYHDEKGMQNLTFSFATKTFKIMPVREFVLKSERKDFTFI